MMIILEDHGVVSTSPRRRTESAERKATPARAVRAMGPSRARGGRPTAARDDAAVGGDATPARALAVLGGAGLLVCGVVRGSWVGAGLACLGGLLAYRGLTA